MLARDLVATADADDRRALAAAPAGRRATRCAGPSTSTACSARPPRCWCAASAAWSPRGCWPAPSGVPATTSATSPWPPPWPGRRRTSRSTSTPSARSPTRSTPHCSSMNVPEAPFVLHLPNVMHLATDVAGVVHDAADRRRRSSWPRRCTRRPPSAARRPTEATALIAEIEGMDRGRYAGPVGWMDATGDGEWGIALRSAEIDGDTGAAVRRLRHRRRLRPGGRARRGAGQVRPGARLPRRQSTDPHPCDGPLVLGGGTSGTPPPTTAIVSATRPPRGRRVRDQCPGAGRATRL